MSENTNLLQDSLVKGKVPKEIVDAAKDHLSPFVPPSTMWQIACLSSWVILFY